ncbi:bifunctional folylpolyglutamate synthase/dihydrofolate synthase, partial [mine drainage metagenome]
TSPHLLRYNERVRIDAHDAENTALCAAFMRIEQARGATPLTYFEYGTLAALLLFADAHLDVVLLEVGLGGRLDAVNIIDADVAIVTTIGIDHTEYLGPDRDSIGREKAGIARAGRPLIIGALDPPPGLLDSARANGACVLRLGVDFSVVPQIDAWCWQARQMAN